MSDHLTEAETYELAVAGDVPEAAAAHVASCASCAAGVAATRRLLDDVEALPAAIAAPGGLADRLARRLDGRPAVRDRRHPGPGVPGWLLRIAAAATFFAAGVIAHAGWIQTGESVPGVAPSPAIEVQRAGTEYVATMARLVADSVGISPAEMRTAREVGLAALYGAAFELTRLPVASDATSEIEELAKRAWTGESEEPIE